MHNETVKQFVTRMRQKAKTCEFGDANAVEEQICDQVINKCLSHELRQKGQSLTLQRLKEIACAMEESEKQARSIEGASNASNEVNSVGRKVNQKEDLRTRDVKCFCCGNVGHKANDHQCPARGTCKQCRKCNGTGHLRLYEKQRGSKIVAEAKELEECIGQDIEGVLDTIMVRE